MVTESGVWDWDRLEFMLPRKNLERIAFLPPRDGFGEDRPTWGWEDKREFSTRLTGREDVEHVLRSCVAAKGLWMRVLLPEDWEAFFSIVFHEWLGKNLFEGSFMTNDREWFTRFVILCWLLWKRWCSLLLDSEVGVLGDILMHGNRLVAECIRALSDAKGIRVRRGSSLSWSSQRGASPPLGTLVGSIKRLLGKDWRVVVKHVVHDSNRVADLLANKGRSLCIDSSIFLDHSTDTLSLVEEEHANHSLTLDTPTEVGLVVSFESGGIGR
ncbi:hypothetical protein V6N11_044151 [Hibiscus sabdariffa]|uniref:RNase H type-1 domain-containing protein n=1 Tax=Hibiscus sabdariffa TaxID=183260 RepID=A0ABR2REP3_9ROSI